MRRDMSKVIVERARLHAGPLRKGRTPQSLDELDELPRGQGLHRQARERGGDKALNENLAPLYRFLEKSVGRPWDKVYSELRANIKPGNTVQEHVLSHVADKIHVKVQLVEPTPHAPTGIECHHRRYGAFAVREGDLYVDPRDGIVKRAKNRCAPAPRKYPRWRDNHRLLVRGKLFAKKINGIWHGFALSPFSNHRSVTRVYDEQNKRWTSRVEAWFEVNGAKRTFLKEEVQQREIKANDDYLLNGLERTYGARVLAITPGRALTSDELKKYQLRND